MDTAGMVEKFSGEGDDFGWWKMQMIAALVQKDLIEALEGEPPVSVARILAGGDGTTLDGSDKEKGKATQQDLDAALAWKKMDRKALTAIHLAVTRKAGFHVKKAKTAKEAMQILEDIYEKPSAVNQVFMLKKLVNMRLSDTGSVADHINEFTQVSGQLESTGLKLEHRLEALLFLCSLPESYSTAIQGFTSTLQERVTLKDAVGAILDEENRRKAAGKNQQRADISSSALTVQHKAKTGSGSSGSSSQQKVPRDECYFCHKKGHMKRNCEGYKRWLQKQQTGGANIVTEAEQEDMCLTVAASKGSGHWIVDSGASFHCTSRREVFRSYTAGGNEHVTLADGHKHRVAGKGVVRVSTTGGQLTLRDVRHVPGLQRDLISVGTIAKQGYTVTFTGEGWSINQGARQVAMGGRSSSSSLYITGGSKVDATNTEASRGTGALRFQNQANQKAGSSRERSGVKVQRKHWQPTRQVATSQLPQRGEQEGRASPAGISTTGIGSSRQQRSNAAVRVTGVAAGVGAARNNVSDPLRLASQEQQLATDDTVTQAHGAAASTDLERHSAPIHPLA